MLRNMVTSLLEHEQIQTTLPKAREAARLAEKIITLGKNYNETSYRQAEAFILKPHVLPKLFSTIRERYANRPGGYTRILKYGNRPGDDAPKAILELVDNPRDLKFEMAAKAVGWDLLAKRFEEQGVDDVGPVDVDLVKKTVEGIKAKQNEKSVRKYTQMNLEKALKFRGEDAIMKVTEKASQHMARLLAQPEVLGGLRHKVEVEDEEEGTKMVYKGHTPRVGQRLAGMDITATSLRLAKGALGKHTVKGSNFWERRTKLGVRADSDATSS